MELLTLAWDIAVHLDKHLAALLAQYGTWVYAILFLIVFAETGFVVTPFLPGDSLLFVAGALCGAGSMDLWVLNGTLIAAAVLGNSVNYSIGRYLGYYVSIIPFCMGLIWVAFDRRKQGWHDKLAGTVVIRSKALGAEPVRFEPKR